MKYLLTLVSTFVLLIGYLFWSSASEAQNITSWSKPIFLSLDTEHASSPTLASDSSGTVHAFWSSRSMYQIDDPSVIFYARNQGGSWTEPVDIIMSPDGYDALFPRSIVDNLGRLHLFWSSNDRGFFGSLYHSWAPAGDALSARNWQLPEKIADGTYQSDIKIDSKGQLHVVYASVLDNRGICHYVMPEGSDKWDYDSCIPHVINQRENEYEVRPRLAIDNLDHLHVLWMLDDYAPEAQLGYSSRAIYYARSIDGGMSWRDMIQVEGVDSRDPNHKGRQPDWGNIAVDGQGRIHIVWIGSMDIYRYHMWSDDGGVSWTIPRIAIKAGGYNNWQGLVVDARGIVHFASPSLQGVMYTSWDNGSWETPLIIDDRGDPHHVNMVVSLGNEIHVVWQEYGSMVEGKPSFILYSKILLDSQTIEPLPVPTIDLSTQIDNEILITTNKFVEALPIKNPVDYSDQDRDIDGQNKSFLIGLLPPAVLIVIVMLVYRNKFQGGSGNN